MSLVQDSPCPVVPPQQSENGNVVECVAPAPGDGQEFRIRVEPFQHGVKLVGDLSPEISGRSIGQFRTLRGLPQRMSVQVLIAPAHSLPGRSDAKSRRREDNRG
jgi:hypothetical protein